MCWRASASPQTSGFSMHLVIRVACMAQNAIRPGRSITWKCFLVFFFFCNAVWKDCSCCLMQGCLNMLQNSILSLLWSVATQIISNTPPFCKFSGNHCSGETCVPSEIKPYYSRPFKKIKASVSANNLPTAFRLVTGWRQVYLFPLLGVPPCARTREY